MSVERLNSLSLNLFLGNKDQIQYNKKVHYSKVPYNIQNNYNGLIFNPVRCFSVPFSPHIVGPVAAVREGSDPLCNLYRPKKGL